MWTKICANTSFKDAQLAADLGAHALGFVFAPSPRQVTVAEVAAITSRLPSTIEHIGVFTTENPYEIAQAVQGAGLTGAQLHSTFSPDLVRALRRLLGRDITLIQTIHWDPAAGATSPGASILDQLRQIREHSDLDHVLIDSRFGTVAGGTGIAFDWAEASRVLGEELGPLKLIVAGGLRPENLLEAINTLSPWGVDVATGVEASPGIKDPKKVEAFISKASHASRI